MKTWTLAGILWHQGEDGSSDAKVATYPARFIEMITQLRQDLNAPNVPVIFGELSYARPNSTAFNAMLPSLVKQVPLSALATAEGLEDRGTKFTSMLHRSTPWVGATPCNG